MGIDRMSHHSRSGTVLIIIAGISALLASLTVTFLVRMRADAEEMQLVLKESQARIMLMAACNWIQESSRIGWTPIGADPNAPIDPVANKETFGWIDVRDNKLGPKFNVTEPPMDDDRLFPVGSSRRFPMYVMERPPYAIALNATYNTIRTTASPDPVPQTDPQFGMPYLRYPDPLPALENGWSRGVPNGSLVTDANFGYWAQGDTSARSNSVGMAWFRVWRESGATFVVTCGAGGTEGYRTWNEIPPADREQFSNDPGLFNSILASEVRLWYRVEWSAAVMGMDYHMLDHSLGRDRDHYMVWHLNASHSTAGHEYRTQTHARNMGGTIRWVQRLATEPTNW
jgi:hypothetical protein